MNILEKDIETIKNFIKVAPIIAVRQLKMYCDTKPNDAKVQAIQVDLMDRLGL